MMSLYIEKTSCGEGHKNEKKTEKIGHVLHVLKKSSERDRAREEIFTLGDKIVKLRSVLLEKGLHYKAPSYRLTRMVKNRHCVKGLSAQTVSVQHLNYNMFKNILILTL
jgi:hypothetical protein